MEPYKGIPNAIDFIPYEFYHYELVRQRTLDEFGKSATLLDATTAMNMLGNVSFFSLFPDLFNSTKESLGYFYQPTFEILDNPFTDFEHALSHIRSKCSHTSMGESMLKPDQFFMTGMSYMRLKKLKFKKPFEESKMSLLQCSPYSVAKIPRSILILMDLKRIGIRDKIPFLPYKLTYLPNKFQVDYPEEKKLGTSFHLQYANVFEQRLGLQLVRAVFMDEKYKMLSSTKTSFINTPIGLTTKEPYYLAFTNEVEDQWIHKITDCLHKPNRKEILAQIVNTTHDRSDNIQKIAAGTVESYSKMFLSKSF